MKIELTKKQQQFAEAMLSGKYTDLLFGGAIRGGKSYVAIALVLLLCRMYPGSRWAIVRKDLPTLRRNTIPTFDKIAHPFAGPIKRDEWISTCANGSQIVFFSESFDTDPDLNRWRGLELNGFLLEEGNELQRASFNKAIERAGSWSVPSGQQQPPPFILLTCNPSPNWIKQLFYDPWFAGTLKAPFFYLPASVVDNPHLDPAYVKSLENLKLTDLATYQRFVLGDWSQSDDPTQLIKFDWINASKNVDPIAGKKRLGVDVARYGDDDSCFCEVEGNRVVGLEYHHGLSIDRTAEYVQAKICNGPIDAGFVFVDVVGLGAGVADILQKEGYRVVQVISGAKADENPNSFFQFKNLRSQLWWELREKFRLGQICLDVDDTRLVEDLTAPRYSITSDKILMVESKDDIKKRIGRSTDAGDALVYAMAQSRELAYSYETSTVVRRAPVGTISTELDDDRSPHPHMFAGGGLFGGGSRRA